MVLAFSLLEGREMEKPDVKLQLGDLELLAEGLELFMQQTRPRALLG
jgi:hypothetical protein